MVEDAKWNDALSGGHSLEGSPVEGHSSVEGRRRQSAVQAKEITGWEAQVKRGADQDEDVEEEHMQDLISRMHMKLGIQLESRMRDVDAATYGTVFFIQEALQSRKKCQSQANSAAKQWRSMEAAKTKEVRNLLILFSMLRGFEEAEAVQILRSAAENPAAAGIAHPCYCMQATPNIREARRSAAVASDQLQMEEAETEVPFSWTEEAMTWSQAGAGILKRRTEA